MIGLLKEYLRAHHTVIRMNLTNFECPVCCKNMSYQVYPVRAQLLYDEKYHKHKFYSELSPDVLYFVRAF